MIRQYMSYSKKFYNSRIGRPASPVGLHSPVSLAVARHQARRTVMRGLGLLCGYEATGTCCHYETNPLAVAIIRSVSVEQLIAT